MKKRRTALVLACVLALAMAGGCGRSGGGTVASGGGTVGAEPSSQSQPEPESPAPEELPQSGGEPEGPAIVTEIQYFPEEWTGRLAQLQGDEGLWEREEEVREMTGMLLEKANYICRLAYQDVNGIPVTGYDWGNKVTVEGKRNPYYKVRILPYHNVAELWADVYSVYRKETADSYFGTQYEDLYIDIEGELYTEGDVSAMSKHRVWNIDAAKLAETSPDKLVLEMEVTLMDDTFPSRLELVREDGRWVLTDSYFASMNT